MQLKIIIHYSVFAIRFETHGLFIIKNETRCSTSLLTNNN